jgi:hypothetical protein
MTISELMQRGLLFEAGGDAGGGGGGAEPDFETKLQKGIEAATAGLKGNRDELLAEKRRMGTEIENMRKTLDGLGGEDGIKKLTEFRARLENDEVTKLLAEGKHDEWLDQRTTAMRAEHANQVEKLKTELQSARELAETSVKSLRDSQLSALTERAAQEAEVAPGVSPDIQLYVQQLFEFSEEHGRHVIRDSNGVIVLGKDGESPKTVGEWLVEQKKTKTHWWPPSEGAGAGGGMGSGGRGPDATDISRMSMSEYRKYRETQNMGSGYAGNVRKS